MHVVFVSICISCPVVLLESETVRHHKLDCPLNIMWLHWISLKFRLHANHQLVFLWATRSLWLVYHLLKDEAEKYVEWRPSKTPGLVEPQITCVLGVLEELQQSNRWSEAREWGESTGVDTQEVLLFPLMP